MITKLSQLKEKTDNVDVKALCESTLSALSSIIYNNVSTDARLEIERFAIENLFERLEKYSKEKVVGEWLTNQKRLYTVKNLGVRKAVNTLAKKEGKSDPVITSVLESFKEKLDNDVPEVLLYEDFISALSGFNFLPAVRTELDAVAGKVKQYKNDVDISKILETMKETRSSYLIPYIETYVENYLNNKTEQNKSFLKEALVKFGFDPFVRDIITLVMLDATQLQLEYANAACGIEDKLYSPILYLGESEVLFNIKNTYYVKKGNNVSKLKREEAAKLNEDFKALCETLNLPNVEISKKEIKVFVGTDNAVLTESETLVNGKPYKQSLNESLEVAKWSGNDEFFNIVHSLRENFDEIAELDFVKRVYLLENEKYAADVFKLRDNIFITTFDPLNNKTTFYRNINPIQAEKVMMEHMRFDVSKTFEDILPNKEKILSEIESTKKEYSDYIAELTSKRDQFSFDYYNNEVSKSVVDALTEELEEVKNEYKDYLNEVEQYTSVTEESIHSGNMSLPEISLDKLPRILDSNFKPVMIHCTPGQGVLAILKQIFPDARVLNKEDLENLDNFDDLNELIGNVDTVIIPALDRVNAQGSNAALKLVVESPVKVIAIVYLDGKVNSALANRFSHFALSINKTNENFNVTIADDQSGKSYTVVIPTGAMASKGEQGNGEIGAETTDGGAGTEVGVASLPTAGGAASAVTFDNDKSELISDQPSDERDKVDLGADELEAYADVVDAESELEKGDENGGDQEQAPETPGEAPSEETPAEEPAAAGSDELNLGDTDAEGTAEVEAPEGEGEEEEPKEGEEKPEEKPEEAVGAPSKNLERTNFNKDRNPKDLGEPKKKTRVVLKRPKGTKK
jgi:hypothetical protein